jgi:hypothetical protein
MVMRLYEWGNWKEIEGDILEVDAVRGPEEDVGRGVKC